MKVKKKRKKKGRYRIQEEKINKKEHILLLHFKSDKKKKNS